MVKSFSTAVVGALFRARWGAAAVLACSWACGGPDSSASVADERGQPAEEAREADPQRDTVRRERGSGDLGTEGGSPSSSSLPNVAGCTGTCEQVCDCVEQACEAAGASTGCAVAAAECRVSCRGSICRERDPQCWLPLPTDDALPPEDPEPKPPGPGPDPSPVDAPNGSSNGNAARPSGQSYGPGGY